MPSRPLFLMLALASAPTVHPTEAPPPDPTPEERKISVHGYLSQAYAFSDRYQLLGIPKSGTADYRTAAIQLRAEVSPKDSFVIQLSHERLGDSPSSLDGSDFDIRLGWIFYERQLANNVSARVGKVKIPLGIYNEIRYVGPLLPYFRAAEAFYGGGSYSFDSLDGAVLTGRWLSGHPFSIDLDVFAGEWRFVQSDELTLAHAKKGLGAQVWLNTPAPGLRFGVFGTRSKVQNILHRPAGTRETHVKWGLSVDGNFTRVRVNAELQKNSFVGGYSDSGYVLLSWRPIDKLTLTGQVSRRHLKLDTAHFDFDSEISRDYAVGAGYEIRPNVRVKAEKHWARGLDFQVPDRTLSSPALESRYVILSLATLF